MPFVSSTSSTGLKSLSRYENSDSIDENKYGKRRKQQVLIHYHQQQVQQKQLTTLALVVVVFFFLCFFCLWSMPIPKPDAPLLDYSNNFEALRQTRHHLRDSSGTASSSSIKSGKNRKNRLRDDDDENIMLSKNKVNQVEMDKSMAKAIEDLKKRAQHSSAKNDVEGEAFKAII